MENARSEMIASVTAGGQLQDVVWKQDEKEHAAMDAASKLAYNAAEFIVRHRGCLFVDQDYNGSSEHQGGYLSFSSGQQVRVRSDLYPGVAADRFRHYVFAFVVVVGVLEDGRSEEETGGWVPFDIMSVSLGTEGA